MKSRYLIIVLCFSLFFNTYSQTNEKVVAQMNYCINSLTNIINASSVEELDHEIDQILNFLTVEEIIGMPDIQNFRTSLFEAASELQINQQEKDFLIQKQKLRRDKARWNALSAGLDNTMMLIPGVGGNKFGPQLAFYGLLSVARTGVDFMHESKQMDLDEMVELWNLKKKDLETWKSLRSRAMDIIFKLYNQYNLKEFDRLTEQTSNLLNNISKEPDSKKRLRLLLDNKNVLGNQLTYNYQIGMAYYEIGDFNSAEQFFRAYEEKYKRLRLFRYDERSGLIALARLQVKGNLTIEESSDLINNILFNLPDNGTAHLACAIYLMSNGKYVEAAQLLRQALDRPNISERQALLLAATKMLPKLSSDSRQYKELLDVIRNFRSSSLYVGMFYDVYGGLAFDWNFWNNILKFSHISFRPWYTLWMGHRQLHKKFELAIPEEIKEDTNFQIYRIEKRKKHIKILEEKYKYKYGVNKSEILKKIRIIRDNPQLLSIFFKPVIEDSIYFVKNNINVEELKNCSKNCKEFQQLIHELPGVLFECDDHADKQIKKNVKQNQNKIKQLAKFLKEHKNKSPEFTIFSCSPVKRMTETIRLNSIVSNEKNGRIKINYGFDRSDTIKNDARIKLEYTTENILYHPILSSIEYGDFILLKFNDIEEFDLLYKFDKSKGELIIWSISFQGITYSTYPQKYPVCLSNPKLVTGKQETEILDTEAKEESKWYCWMVSPISSIWSWMVSVWHWIF